MPPRHLLMSQPCRFPRKYQTFCTTSPLGHRNLRASCLLSKKEANVDRPTEQFIHDQNIHRYRRLLWRVTDESERLVLLELLADEEAKQMDRRLPDRRRGGSLKHRQK
jgi:hypothetical protein